jgi:hypothetical protein
MLESFQKLFQLPLKIEYLNLFNHAYFVAITVFPPIAFGLIPHLLVFKGKRCQLENQI